MSHEMFWCDLCDVGAESAPPGWNRVKVSENLGATAVAPAVTSLVPNPSTIVVQKDSFSRPPSKTIKYNLIVFYKP